MNEQIWNHAISTLNNQGVVSPSSQQINQRVNQLYNQALNQEENRARNRSNNQVANQVKNQIRNQATNQLANQGIDEPTNQQLNQQINRLNNQARNQEENRAVNQSANPEWAQAVRTLQASGVAKPTNQQINQRRNQIARQTALQEDNPVQEGLTHVVGPLEVKDKQTASRNIGTIGKMVASVISEGRSLTQSEQDQIYTLYRGKNSSGSGSALKFDEKGNPTGGAMTYDLRLGGFSINVERPDGSSRRVKIEPSIKLKSTLNKPETRGVSAYEPGGDDWFSSPPSGGGAFTQHAAPRPVEKTEGEKMHDTALTWQNSGRPTQPDEQSSREEKNHRATKKHKELWHKTASEMRTQSDVAPTNQQVNQRVNQIYRLRQKPKHTDYSAASANRQSNPSGGDSEYTAFTGGERDISMMGKNPTLHGTETPGEFGPRTHTVGNPLAMKLI